jgi:hypothetical protein
MGLHARTSGVLFESCAKCMSAKKGEEIQKKFPGVHRNTIQNADNTA